MVRTLPKQALATMQMQGFGLLVPIKLNGSDLSLSVRASCGTPVKNEDKFSWGADVSLWSSNLGTPNTVEGFLTPRININKDTSSTIESVVPFNRTTRTIVFKHSWVSRSGICANENLELFYGQKKIITIPSDTEIFTVRLFP